MDAVKIYEEAARKVGRGEINLMEFWKLIRPLRDVEAVVRCRDCKHLGTFRGKLYCRHNCGIVEPKEPTKGKKNILMIMVY